MLRHVTVGLCNQSTGLPTQVNAVMGYNSGAGNKLFAASGTAIYDCTAAGAVGTPVVTGLISDKFIHTNFATPGGNFLYAVNGADAPRLYNGTTWNAITAVSTPAITGVTTTLLSTVYATKARLWFIEKNSLRVWYLPVNSIAGAASQLDFSSLCRRGGTLVAMASWTVTGGFGSQDYTVFATSEGEILIYQGTDPSTASAWSLVGVWKFGSPMTNKCFCHFGADLLYISKDGLTPMSQGRFFADVSDKDNLTNKIQAAISTATTQFPTAFGWICTNFPLENMLLLNIPKGLGQQEQYVMNTISGAWCNFTGWSANTFELYQDNLYFGGNGVVSQAWNGLSDNGVQINADAIQAPNYFESRGKLKRFTMMRPIVSSSGIPAIYANVNIDFDTTPPSSILNFSGVSASTWDVATWDAGMWGGDNVISKNWQGINGIGYSASPRFKTAANGFSVNWISTDFVLEVGGIL